MTAEKSRKKLKQFLAKSLIRTLEVYQARISPLLRSACVFYPTCSEYTKQAIKKYGAGKGLLLGIRRILRCHPWQKNHIDPLK